MLKFALIVVVGTVAFAVETVRQFVLAHECGLVDIDF